MSEAMDTTPLEESCRIAVSERDSNPHVSELEKHENKVGTPTKNSQVNHDQLCPETNTQNRYTDDLRVPVWCPRIDTRGAHTVIASRVLQISTTW